MLYTTTPSPIGELLLLASHGGSRLCGLHMQEAPNPLPIDPQWEAAGEVFDDVIAQLREYFAGQRKAFDLPLLMEGTAFQRRVWTALQDIPYGMTISYAELARRVGQPTASRAVGLANGRNPVAIIVPCHRVVGSNGRLTGYGGGLPRKRFLLDLESPQPALAGL
jgi:methylated-DNA-[protein]-cysteine S-methyltransferase